MSDYYNKETEETVEEENIVENGESNESSKKSMHLQLTVEGEAEAKLNVKGFETQDSPVSKGSKEDVSWKELKTQDSPDSKTDKGLVDWMAHKTEEDEIQGFCRGPPADYIGSKTIDDDLKPPVAEHRAMKTVEEEEDSYEPYQSKSLHHFSR